MKLILGCLWLLVYVCNNILTLCILRSAIPHLPGCFLPLDLLSENRIQHGTIGPFYVQSSYSTKVFYRIIFRLCAWLSSWRLLSWINHLPPVCLSTFWKSTFKQQLGCRFDIMHCKSLFYLLFLYFDKSNWMCLITSYDFSALSLHLK